jgi:alpha,alpha-trehalase
MDEIARFGFIPNGGRIYYLNRSQPPVFIAMLAKYIEASKDTGILRRGLPLAERELQWWTTQRTINVTSPFTNTTHELAHYAVGNSAPRPESYFQDYSTANDPTLPSLTQEQRSALYAELASGAESGWDYSSRWMAQPNASTNNAALRTLRTRAVLPVDLNSILYKAHTLVAGFYKDHSEYAPNPKNASQMASQHQSRAEDIKKGVLDLFWDDKKLAFYDFILPSSGVAATDNSTNAKRAGGGEGEGSLGAHSTVFSAAHYYPFWNGIYPPSVLASSAAAYGAFASLGLVLARYNGTLPSTFLTTGQQWDAPNAWPPHQYIALEALRGLPKNVTGGPWGVNSSVSSWSLVPQGQLNLDETELPAQPLSGTANASRTGTAADFNVLNRTVINGGNASNSEGWASVLERGLANRYITSALCSWRATGGAIEGVLPRLSDKELNVTQSVGNTGNVSDHLFILQGNTVTL